MSTPSSNSLLSSSFAQTTRVEGALPGLARANKPGPPANEQFAQLMKSYGGAQATPPKPQTSMPATQADAVAKPSAPSPVRQAPEGKTELQRQEEKLAQKKITQSNDSRPRQPSSGQAQKGVAHKAPQDETEKRQAPNAGSGSATAYSESAEQAANAKTKNRDSNDQSVAAETTAAAAAAQQALSGAALVAADSSTIPDAAAGRIENAQGSAKNGMQSIALQASSEGEADIDRTGAQAGATATPAGPSRAALHAQQSAATATLQVKQAAGGPAAELDQGVASNFSRELQSAQGNLSARTSTSKSEGFALEGMMSAAGIAAPASFEARREDAAATQLTISQPLTEPSFAPEMAARLSVLAADGVQEARLHLNPAEMGPVSVQIIVEGQQAQVSFHAEHEQTRAVLEQSLPDLAAALRDSGLTLSGGGVFQQPGEQSRQAQQGPEAEAQRSSGLGKNLSLSASSQAAPVQIRHARGVVDLYA
ncbi:flagellar hook-length control protein FliK [Roseateles albus]|uniref:Flagellar hook-length control protein FliK n=1 Tax=Roseateles albus TaxID=2987525 RepID=A0ABT5KIR7_9BURK|nr:flagellar hook-length control protein FliK [Roseateles albus]MDC8773813.1 flagellar hook-length control protein FliK [Roseateles albus]